jgi:glycosyltransferase involved in cell wall biosynthesis
MGTGFGVAARDITVIPFGINDDVPNTKLTSSDARKRLGIRSNERTILFFGNIAPYKGLEVLARAFQELAARNDEYRLVVAGKVRAGCEEYVAATRQMIEAMGRSRVIQRYEYIPDEETEVYLKAADVLVLPYREIFQSGVLFLAYSFGLPVIVTDVGSLREDVVEGKTGFVCRPDDADDLAAAIDAYFESDLFKNLEERRREIQEYAKERNSWAVVGEATCGVYRKLLETDRG